MAVVWMLGLVVVRVVLVPPERCAAPAPEAVSRAADAATAWAVAALRPDGSFLYRYDRTEGDVGGYNLVRHAGMTMALHQRARVDGDAAALAAGDRSLDWMLDRLVPAGPGATAFAAPGAFAKLGASALLAVALVQRRDATGDTTHDPLLTELARFMVGQQQPDGRMLALWDPATGEPAPGVLSPFATGEAFWALVLIDDRLGGPTLSGPVRRLADYLALDRRSAEGHVLRVPDHWAAYGFAELARTDPAAVTDDHVAYLRALAGDLATMTRYESTRTGEGLSRLTRGYTALPAGVGALGEGLAGLRDVAVIDPRLGALAAPLEDHLACVADLLVSRQVTAPPASALPPEVDGAWFSSGVTQVDDQQHALSALLAYR